MTDVHEHDPELEALLRSAGPRPSARYEADLHRQLFSPRESRFLRLRGAGGLLAATGGLATVLVVAGLVGGGPLSPDGGDDARARPGCTTHYVTEVQPAGEVVRRADGSVTVETTRKPVSRAVERCR
ncbi:MAG: hypothetical protein Q7T55_17400 [Solirubrobacteraceae bacterium]|nr:hypothetical protein [Solirubrobacteraceae bacterium]